MPTRPAAPLAPVVLLLAGLLLLTGCASGSPRRNLAQPAYSPVPIGIHTPEKSASPSPSRSPSAAASSARPRGSARPSGATPTRSPSPRPTVGPAGSANLTGSSAIALTFDDGPDPTYTPQILDVLARYGVKATFCLIGSRARDYPDLVRRIAAEGHSLCNHSWQHLMDLATRTPSYQQWDLSATNDAIHAAVPDARIRYFRAPGGNFTPALVQLAASYAMRSIYWDVDPRDWDSATYGKGTGMVNHIVSVVRAQTRPGSIVLSHDRAHPDTIAAYTQLLPWLKARFTLVRLE